MKLLCMFFVFVMLFLISYIVCIATETIKLIRNPRPRFWERENFRFSEVPKIKTQEFGKIEVV